MASNSDARPFIISSIITMWSLSFWFSVKLSFMVKSTNMYLLNLKNYYWILNAQILNALQFEIISILIKFVVYAAWFPSLIACGIICVKQKSFIFQFDFIHVHIVLNVLTTNYQITVVFTTEFWGIGCTI